MSFFVGAVNLSARRSARTLPIICLYLYRDAHDCFSPCWTCPSLFVVVVDLFCCLLHDEIALLIQ
jgi:hypothetical protein